MIRVKLEDTNEYEAGLNTPFGHKNVRAGVRRVNIATQHGSFSPPMRVINRNDLNAKNRVPEMDSIFNASKVFLYEEYFNHEKAFSFPSDNTAFEKLFNTTADFFPLVRNSFLRLFQPSLNKETIQIMYSNEEKTREYLKAVADFQMHAGFDAICLPVIKPLESKFTSGIDYLGFILEEIDVGNSQIIPIVDMGYNENTVFTDIMNRILSRKNELVPIVMLKHRKFKSAFWNYNALHQFSNTDKMAFMYSSINKREYDDDFSETHSSEFFFGDLYSYRYRTGRGSGEPMLQKFFQRKLNVRPLSEIYGEDGAIEPLANSKYSREITELINEGHASDIDGPTLSAYSRLHEHFISNDELQKSRKFLKSSSAYDYVDVKKELKTHMEKLGKETVARKR